tara:strand:- start:6631 stop:6813 length:183 start_codon:yes stop_codon:yes gene_type:complete
MLIYSGPDILEVLPQQVIESDSLIEHPYLRILDTKENTKTSKKTYPKKSKKVTKPDGINR